MLEAVGCKFWELRAQRFINIVLCIRSCEKHFLLNLKHCMPVTFTPKKKNFFNTRKVDI